jgi:hypothetical protein
MEKPGDNTPGSIVLMVPASQLATEGLKINLGNLF